MSSAKITLYGFADYMNSIDNDLFRNMLLPEGIEKDTLVENILLRGAEFEVLYSNPYFMQQAIGTWSKKWYKTIDKWVKALAIEYNPLENYDRQEEWTTTDNGGTTSTSHSTDSTNASGSNSGSVGVVSDSTTENKTSAYNSSEYQPDNKSRNDSNNTTTSSDNSTSSTSGTSDISSSGTSNNTNVRVGRTHGNIGVTTSQQMLQSELDIARWNIYEQVTDLFLAEFILPVY